jgi:site-specific DNA-methyltransferase (adenine-specific)
MSVWKNTLYFGDNLRILREHIPDASVDLIYLDPPFNSKATYNVLFKERDGSGSSAQITAFDDSWHWDAAAAETYYDLVTRGPKKLADLMNALHSFLGQNDMMAYLTMMAIRLVEMHRVLKDTGSIYLHCDPTASHYLKVVLDAVFGAENFRNEIIWQRTSSHNDSKRWGQVHDTLLFYSKDFDFTWNPVFLIHDPHYVAGFYRYTDDNGTYRLDHIIRSKSMGPRPNLSYEYKGYTPQWGWRVIKEKLEKLDSDGRITWSKSGRPYLKRYLTEQKGTPVKSVITDIHPLSAQSAEKLGYPTQKPETLLERIIRASSNEGDIVLDPFCGCGTTVNVAERLHRRWIGIDITHLAITLIKHRLEDTFRQDIAPYEIIGDPKDIGNARALAAQDKYQFEWWALSLVDARPAQDKKKGADRGVDGYIYFFDDESGQAKKVVVQVKSGHVNAAQIRDLKGTIEREKAVIGVFITLEESTAPMRSEAADAGFYEMQNPISGRAKFPRIQVFTVEELLNGAMVKIPAYAMEATIKRAERKKKEMTDEQLPLL